MRSSSHFKTFGVFVPADVSEALAEHLKDEAGVCSFEEYFDPTTSTVSHGDPAAEITNKFSRAVLDEFAYLYDAADFERARQVGHDKFELITLAADPQTVSALKDLFRAASKIQDTDTRTVHTAILRAALETTSLPSVPTDAVIFDDSSNS